jgi:glutathione peroxidase
VTFPLFAKIDVNGPNAHPLYKYLKHEAKGLLGSEAIKWNFTKFLVDSAGSVRKRYAPTDTPESIKPELGL